MKKVIYLFALASLFACCNNEELSPPSKEIELVSKATEYSLIKEGQQIGVTISGLSGISSTYENKPWTVGAGGVLSTAPALAPNWGESDIEITAYHPYDADLKKNQMYFTVKNNQSDEGNGFQDSDLMWCSTTSSPSKEVITLDFTHLLSKIDVELKTPIPGATISICNTLTSTYFYLTSGKISVAAGEKETIKAGITTEEKMTASAIIVPQKVSAGTKVIRVDTADKTYYYSLESNVTFESGQTYKYELTLPTDGTQVMSVRRL